MRFSPLLALGAGQVAMAAFGYTNTTTIPVPTGTPVLPGQIGIYELYGCTRSSVGFPTFVKVATSPVMDLEFCAASCSTRYFGTHGPECYCGQVVDPATSQIVAGPLCALRCPGDRTEACGGDVGLIRRQEVPLTFYLSVYIRAEFPIIPTVTTTIVSVSTGIITTCPPNLPQCRVGATTTATLTITTAIAGPITTGITPITTRITPINEFNKKKIICYGDHCAAEYYGEHGEKNRIVCHGDECHPEVHNEKDFHKLVHCKDDKCHFPECKGDECKRKIVCFDGKCAHEKCFEDECEKKFVCHGDDCKFEKCHGDECHKKFNCDKECKVEPPCHDKCPEPSPPRKHEDHDHDHKDHDHDHKDDHKDHDHDHKDDHKDHDHGHKDHNDKDHGKGASPGSGGARPNGGAGGSPAVVVAGCDRTNVAFNLLGAAAGLIFLL